MSPLRSAGWFDAPSKNGILHRSSLRSEGLPDDSFTGRPVIGVATSWSELTPCNMHLREVAEHVKRKGYPGMPEIANLPLPTRLAETPGEPWPATRGYQRLYVDHVLQADEGADFDFLVGMEPATVPRRSQ